MSQQNKDLARRREEIERKRRQLQGIQDRQAQELGQSLLQPESHPEPASKASSMSVDVDALLQSVLPPQTASSFSPFSASISSSSSSALPPFSSSPFAAASGGADSSQAISRTQEKGAEDAKQPVTLPSSSPLRRERAVRLTLQPAESSPSFDLDPQQVETYTKAVQTSDEFVTAEATLAGPIDSLPTPKSRAGKERGALLPSDELHVAEQMQSLPQNALPPQKTLTPEQIESIVDSEAFVRFVERSAKVVQRVLEQPEVDFTVDYASDAPTHDSVSTADLKFSVLRKNKVDHLTAGHTVTSIEWSPKNPDLYLASYFNNNLDSTQFKYGGSVLVWSMILSSVPEFTFRCNSPVTSACFSPFNPNLILGGTQSGQVVLWDIRDKSLPVQKSKISSKSHNHPVRCLKVTGNQNAHKLTTISNDGRICSWSLDRLSDPQDSSELPCSLVEQTKRIPIAATCFSYIHETSSPVIGTEEGSLYEVSRSASKWGVKECYTGHNTIITSVECNSYAVQHRNYTDLILTSSLDWSCKLWSRKAKSVISTFEVATDYVYDAKWCPSNPSLFATADGTGTVSLWDLATQPESPCLQKNLGLSAVNSLSWSTDSKYLAAGDSDGTVTIFRVNQELTSFSKDSAQKFERYLAKVQNPTATEELFSR